jgi:hypothetical protein
MRAKFSSKNAHKKITLFNYQGKGLENSRDGLRDGKFDNE